MRTPSWLEQDDAISDDATDRRLPTHARIAGVVALARVRRFCQSSSTPFATFKVASKESATIVQR
jgi:hypothetical protein